MLLLRFRDRGFTDPQNIFQPGANSTRPFYPDSNEFAGTRIPFNASNETFRKKSTWHS